MLMHQVQNLSKGLDAASGSESVLLSLGVGTSLFVGIAVFCFEEIILGGKWCGGLMQGNSMTLRMFMCVNELMPDLGQCSVKRHETKTPLGQSLQNVPQDCPYY
jgi:hypothetical protein